MFFPSRVTRMPRVPSFIVGNVPIIAKGTCRVKARFSLSLTLTLYDKYEEKPSYDLNILL